MSNKLLDIGDHFVYNHFRAMVEVLAQSARARVYGCFVRTPESAFAYRRWIARGGCLPLGESADSLCTLLYEAGVCKICNYHDTA
eukprot:jgi/Botrbrau1/17546/Bobra.0766s0002.1